MPRAAMRTIWRGGSSNSGGKPLKEISLTDPQAAWVARKGVDPFFAYDANYLIHNKFGTSSTPMARAPISDEMANRTHLRRKPDTRSRARSIETAVRPALKVAQMSPARRAHVRTRDLDAGEHRLGGLPIGDSSFSVKLARSRNRFASCRTRPVASASSIGVRRVIFPTQMQKPSIPIEVFAFPIDRFSKDFPRTYGLVPGTKTLRICEV